MATAVAADPSIPSSVANSLEMSYAGAQSVAGQYPQYASQITAAAKASFLAGDQYAYIAGIIAVLIGAALVFWRFPRPEEERRLLQEYHDEDLQDTMQQQGIEGQPVTAPDQQAMANAEANQPHEGQ